MTSDRHPDTDIDVQCNLADMYTKDCICMSGLSV